ncbi:GDSL esterase/lipase EXL3-like isoform X2 [Asparagus officinalis]|uniref:GDSL esterase/lipase EXL3-like isoform X2 n=1 Tax=Asparagus officinalis TaxID=4686 RepID=UPI00098E19CD|nr:GDSL esterase/lipase EXL3-like isoform X2 [Asparagus officinalis]
MQALFVGFICVCLLLASARARTAKRLNGIRPALYPGLFAFGDSILDTGNNNLLTTVMKSNFPPYGKDFAGHEPTGRFTNGQVPSDLIASKLGIKDLLPAYLSPKLSSEELLTGVCFASVSSGYDRLTSEVWSVMTIQDQLDLFKDYKKKLQAITDTERAAKIIGESIYIVCSGSNDFANTYFSSPLRRAEYDVSAYTSFLVNSASSFLEELYNLGTREIAVVGLPPLGCLPSQRTLAGGIPRDCVSSYNQASENYNVKLSREVEILQKKFVGATIIYIDIYQKLLHLIQDPSKYDS